MANIYLKLLEEFESTGLSSRKSISPFMERSFKKPSSNDPQTWVTENYDAALFLQDVRHTNHFDFDENEMFDIHPGRWYDVVNINARITILGLEYLERHETNVKIVANSAHQTKLFGQQTDILKSQRKYLYLTAFFTGVTLAIAIFNYISDNSKVQLRQQLQEQTEQIHTLETTLFQTMNRRFHEIEAKKSLPKKP